MDIAGPFSHPPGKPKPLPECGEQMCSPGNRGCVVFLGWMFIKGKWCVRVLHSGVTTNAFQSCRHLLHLSFPTYFEGLKISPGKSEASPASHKHLTALQPRHVPAKHAHVTGTHLP